MFFVPILGTLPSCSSHSSVSVTASTTTFLPPLPTKPQAPGYSADVACAQIMALSNDWQNLSTDQASSFWRKSVDNDIAKLPASASAFTQQTKQEPTRYRKLASETNALVSALQRHDNGVAATILNQVNADCFAAPIHLP
jgi:hypothetical protein